MARRTDSLSRTRVLAPADWIAAAMDALVEGGVSAVAVEAIAARLGTTKGSFYHHFKNRDALIRAALEEWERRDTLEVRERLERISDPRARIHAVMTAAITDRQGGVRDAALMASGKHPLVRPIVERATKLRIRYLTDTYVQLGLSRAQARRRAVLTSVTYLGLYEYIRGLDAKVSDAELGAYADELLTLLVPPANPVAA
ncbi:MAG: TetR/AcrR family transcriptional regulator [Solirubrobacteraceae bacterium]